MSIGLYYCKLPSGILLGTHFIILTIAFNMGYWHQRADKRHVNPPTGNSGAISGQRQSWKTPGELGVSKSVECDIFPSVL